MNLQFLFFCYNDASFQDSLLKLLRGQNSLEAGFPMKAETASCNTCMRNASPSVGGKVLLLCLWEQLVCYYLNTDNCSEAIADVGVLSFSIKSQNGLAWKGL